MIEKWRENRKEFCGHSENEDTWLSLTSAKVKVPITFHLFGTRTGFLPTIRDIVFRLFSLLFDLSLCMSSKYINIWNRT
jgi:hypothetical protein